MAAVSRTSELQARRAKRVASLAIAEATYDDLLAKQAKEYTFNGGEGSQSVKRQDLDIIKKQIDQLQSEIDDIDRRLQGAGVVGLSVQRWQTL